MRDQLSEKNIGALLYNRLSCSLVCELEFGGKNPKSLLQNSRSTNRSHLICCRTDRDDGLRERDEFQTKSFTILSIPSCWRGFGRNF